MKRKTFSRGWAISLLVALLSVAILGQQAKTNSTGVSADLLRGHVTFLASDALEGRRTGTPGADDAAKYIVAAFSRAGLRSPDQVNGDQKSAGVARFTQRFPYVAGVKLGKKNSMSSNGVTWRVGDDWMPLGISSNAVVDGPVTFVGYGITASELNHNDYGPDVSGRVAIALSGTPDGDNPHGQFARYEDVRWKAIAARSAGVKALVVIAREENFMEDRLSRLRYDNTAGDAGLPVVALSKQAAESLLGLPISDLEQRARSGTTSPAQIANRSLTITTDVVRSEVNAANVIGVLQGSDTSLKNEVIVLGAHYDHLGRGGEGSLAPTEGDIHHGADDNASGVAGLLELARVLSSQRPAPRRTILFIAFSGEEEGLLGSNYYVNHPVFPLNKTIAMINMDMIGRLRNRTLVVGGVGTAKEWRDILDSANVAQGITVTAGTNGSEQSPRPGNYPMVVAANGRTVVGNDLTKQFVLTMTEDGFGPSDHSSFYAKKIPVLFFWTGTHGDYHKPSDTADKINYEGEGAIVSLIARIVNDIDSGKPVTYTVAKSESTGRSTGFRVYLGTIPNYADSTDGLLLDGVREDSPAAKAGIKAGDRVVKLAGRDVHNVYDYTYALGEMKAGEEYEVEVLRGGERLKLKITPAARK
ncbi:MAG: hypothetical protein C5B44_04920 [Acidobacteria bacterium]|nr:MAG: hypothetical protein C5B44_04920 [Acidobacteriota bacterium]